MQAGLLSLASLRQNEALRELHLLGNPCSQWPSYRAYVIALLPRLRQLVCSQPSLQSASRNGRGNRGASHTWQAGCSRAATLTCCVTAYFTQVGCCLE